MRLDKFLSETGTASRSESRKAARAGGISVNGAVIYDTAVHIDPEKDEVSYMGNRIVYRKYSYLMLNKPEGVVSATDDGTERTVLDLLPDKYRKMGLFPCGRLDKNTTGLLILTNNGALAHRLLSPKCHVEKTYRFTCERALTDADCELLRRGVDIGEKSSTLPAKLMLFSGRSGEITVTEGKYHQIKRMFQAVCNKILSLERISFAGIPLDSALARGGWRELTAAEAAYIESK
ncbi:MAG: rRNA pseudouridine synthase [Clostridiales bacterium]|nr:rRNA pseudouridine synthase [Clostridiales bacterium]